MRNNPMRFPDWQKIAGRAFRASNPSNNQVRCLLGVRRICASRNAFPATKETLKIIDQRTSFLSSSSLVCAIGSAMVVPQLRNNSHETPKVLKNKVITAKCILLIPTNLPHSSISVSPKDDRHFLSQSTFDYTPV